MRLVGPLLHRLGHGQVLHRMLIRMEDTHLVLQLTITSLEQALQLPMFLYQVVVVVVVV